MDLNDKVPPGVGFRIEEVRGAGDPKHARGRVHPEWDLVLLRRDDEVKSELVSRGGRGQWDSHGGRGQTGKLRPDRSSLILFVYLIYI